MDPFAEAFEKLTLDDYRALRAEIHHLTVSLAEMTRRSSWHMHQVGVRDATISELHLKLATATLPL
jgi:hypothetical protein